MMNHTCVVKPDGTLTHVKPEEPVEPGPGDVTITPGEHRLLRLMLDPVPPDLSSVDVDEHLARPRKYCVRDRAVVFDDLAERGLVMPQPGGYTLTDKGVVAACCGEVLTVGIAVLGSENDLAEYTLVVIHTADRDIRVKDLQEAEQLVMALYGLADYPEGL